MERSESFVAILIIKKTSPAVNVNGLFIRDMVICIEAWKEGIII